MEFIKKYHIDVPPLTMTEEFTNGTTGSLTAIVEKICAISIEKHENILIGEIVKIAKENGITDLYLLNKDAIVEALSKQIPQAEKDGCPRCHYDLKCDSYCPNCGQKILMDPETGYPIRED